MAISSSVRKMLWAKSGNKCAFCEKELVKTQFGLPIICGEECHIVSQKPNGPRHRNLENYDAIDNLILLCQEHHKMIDDNPNKFNEKFLKDLKAKHETKLKLHINNNNLILMTKVDNAKDLVRYLNGAEQYATDYPTNKEDDFLLFEEFFDLVNNFDILDEYNEFDQVRYITPSFKKIQEKGYIVACSQVENYGKYSLKTSFVFILTKEQYQQVLNR